MTLHWRPTWGGTRRALLPLAWTILAGSAQADTAPAADAPATCPPTPIAPTPAQVQAGLRQARDHGFLWRITKGGHASWLYGTLHVGRYDWTFPGPHLRDALRASDLVALEIDPLDPETEARIERAMSAQPRTPLPAALQQRLDRVAAAQCVPPAALAMLAPEMQIEALSTLIGRHDGLDADHGADVSLAGYARGAGRPVVALETPEQQIALLQGDTAEETIAYVDTSLAEMEAGKARTMLLHVARVWAEGDWTELTRYADWCDCLNTPADRNAMARLLDQRNPGMADGIAALHEGGSRVFAAVGSLHMIGATGLPALLARRGYRVEQIAIDQPPETNK